MTRRAGSYLWAILIVAAIGCSAYTDGSGRTEPDAAVTFEAPPDVQPVPPPSTPPPASPEPPVDAGVVDAGSDATTPDMPMTPEQAPIEMDAGRGSAETGNDTNLRIARSDRFESYLTDALDRPLYMFAADVPGTNNAACLGDCARAWPPFDVEIAKLPPGIDPADVSRFHRQDGAWQTRYKGYPLYYRSTEAGSTDVGSDGVDDRWFVARDYFTFLATARSFAPEGGTGTSTFLTDGYGRTLYVCLDDRPAMGMIEAFSSCEGDCTRERPLFVASEGDQTSVLPSTLDPADIGRLTRPNGASQLTYRGWPLYYFSADISAGATAGHNERAWRAIDPSSFGRQPDSTN